MHSAMVITLSDKGAAGAREDLSGPAVAQMLKDAGYDVRGVDILPDEMDLLRDRLIELCADVDLIVTTGGTGLSPRDITPEATLSVIERRVPGIPEAMRAAGMQHTNRAMLSRGEAGIRQGTLIINLPGSQRAASQSLQAVMDPLMHALDKIKGSTDDCAQEN